MTPSSLSGTVQHEKWVTVVCRTGECVLCAGVEAFFARRGGVREALVTANRQHDESVPADLSKRHLVSLGLGAGAHNV